MNTQVEALLRDQINKEFYSAYLYLAMSNYYYGEIWTASATGLKCRPGKNRNTP